MGVLVLAFLFMLRPPALGGTASYITVQQTGLEPLLYKGDLAIVKQDGAYEPGQLIAVQTQQGPFFGRILGQEAEVIQVRLFAGANPIAVSQEYVLGRLWFNIGDLGRRVSGVVLDQFGLSAEAAR
jgi:hypothetical protein